MQLFRTNPPSRAVPPRAMILPSEVRREMEREDHEHGRLRAKRPVADATLLAEIDAFLRRRGMKPTLFGRIVANSPALLGNLRDGRAIGEAMRLRIRSLLNGEATNA